MTNEQKLLPCPFCGGDMEDRGYGAIHVSGTGCPLRDLAIDPVKWNARAVLAATEPAPKTVISGDASVAVCPICDIAGCRHLRGSTEPAPQPVADAMHRSFPEAGDGRPMPPMGDDLMTAGLSADDARFVAIQLAQNGLALVPVTVIDEPEAGEPAVLLVDAVWKPCVHGGGWWIAQDADGCSVLLSSETPVYGNGAALDLTQATAQDAARVPEIAALVEAFKELMADAEKVMNVPATCYAALRAIGGDA